MTLKIFLYSMDFLYFVFLIDAQANSPLFEEKPEEIKQILSIACVRNDDMRVTEEQNILT